METLNRRFTQLTDFISWFMGTPANIFIWIMLGVIWFAAGFLFPKLFTQDDWLPRWFTSEGWNFPLNTITTLAELYIGFLIGSAANRSEKNLQDIIKRTERLTEDQNKMLELLLKDQEIEITEELRIEQIVDQSLLQQARSETKTEASHD